MELDDIYSNMQIAFELRELDNKYYGCRDLRNIAQTVLNSIDGIEKYQIELQPEAKEELQRDFGGRFQNNSQNYVYNRSKNCRCNIECCVNYIGTVIIYYIFYQIGYFIYIKRNFRHGKIIMLEEIDNGIVPFFNRFCIFGDPVCK